MTSMADEGLLSPAYKLGKRALQAIENTHGCAAGPSLKRPFAMSYLHGSSLCKAASMPAAQHHAPTSFLRTMQHAASMEADMPSMLPHSCCDGALSTRGVAGDMAPPPCSKGVCLMGTNGMDAATMLLEMHEETAKIAVCGSSVKRSRQCENAAVTPRAGREQLVQKLGSLAIQPHSMLDRQGPYDPRSDQETPRYEHPTQKLHAFLQDNAHASSPRYSSDQVPGIVSHMSVGSVTSHIHSMVEGTPVHGFGGWSQSMADGGSSGTVAGSGDSWSSQLHVNGKGAEPVEGVPVIGSGPTWQQYHAVVREMRAERDKARGMARKQQLLQQEWDAELSGLKKQLMLLARGKRDAVSSLEAVAAEREALRKALEATARQLDSSHAETGLLSDKVTVLEAMLESQQDEHDQLSKQLEVAYAAEARNKQVVHVLELRCSQLKLHLRNQHGMVAHLVEQMSAGAGTESGDGAGSGCDKMDRNHDTVTSGLGCDWPDVLEPDVETD